MKFTIEICRTSYAFETFDVEANSEKEAKEKAFEMASNAVFSENNAEYNIEEVTINL